MIKPDADTVRAFAHVAQNVPRVGAYLDECFKQELERLADTSRENSTRADS